MTRAAFGPYQPVCSFADRGDGLLIVAPPSVPTMALLKRLIAVLPGELCKHNATHDPAARVQLRVAVAVGPVVADKLGVSGEAIILAARMLESPGFKRAMAETGSVLGVIASGFVYRTAIKHGGAPLDPGDYIRVQVDVKESRMRAWYRLVTPLRRARACRPAQVRRGRTRRRWRRTGSRRGRRSRRPRGWW